MLRDIHFYGVLRKKFGPKITLDVETPGEVVRALDSQIPNFRHVISAGSWCFVRGDKKTGDYLSVDEINFRLGKYKEVHIFPAPKGRKSGGTGKIIAGIVLIVVAVAFWWAGGPAWAAGAMPALFATEAAALGTTISVGMMGVSMVIGGVSMMLAPKPRAPGVRPGESQNESYLFTGPQNTTSQGVPIPLVYGKVRTGSVVAGSRIDTLDFSSQAITQASGGKTGVIGTVFNTVKNF